MSVRALALLAASSWLLACPCLALPLGAGEGEAGKGVANSSYLSMVKFDCKECIDTMKFVQTAFDSQETLDYVIRHVESVCLKATKDVLNYNGEYMCPGILASYGPVLQYVLTHKAIEPREFCQTLHICNQTQANSAHRRKSPLLQAIERMVREVKLTEERRLLKMVEAERHKPAQGVFKTSGAAQLSKFVGVASLPMESAEKTATSSKSKMFYPPQSRQSSAGPRVAQSDTLRILQISDIHLDTDYSEGSPSKCGLYMCCRSWYNGSVPARHYGEYGCDLPLPTLELLTEAIQNLDPQPDFVVYTGDNPPHDIWNNTWTSQLTNTRLIVDYLAEKLPHLTIYPAIGNHESYPESEYLVELPEYRVLNSFLASEWQKWSNLSLAALNNITAGSYYWVDVEEGLRVISMNTDYGYNLNFYAFLNEDNPDYYNQLDWIEQQLAAAEAAEKKVILIGHIPPKGADTLSAYGEFYLNISKRYSDTIVGGLFGHTHHDEFQVVQDADGVYGAIMIAPSVTPYGRMNPSFRVHLLDRSNGYQLMDYEQYHLNLTKANELATEGLKPSFEFSYSPAKLYDLSDLSPNSWAGLAGRFEVEESLVSDYHYNLYGQTYETDRHCDAMCTKNIVCDVLHVVSENYFKCLVSI